MSRAEIKARVAELLAAGTAKSEVFDQLAGQGIKDSRLAYLIASYADPHLCYDNNGKVNVLVTIMLIQALLAAVLGFGIGAKIGPNAQWIVGGLVALIPLLFAWGFYTHKVGAYNVYILMSIIQMPKQFGGFATSPVSTAIGLAIGIGILTFVWHVRRKIFPDFAFITPKKIKGQYVFES